VTRWADLKVGPYVLGTTSGVRSHVMLRQSLVLGAKKEGAFGDNGVTRF